MKIKTCTNCKKELELNKENFYTRKNIWKGRPDIFKNPCKKCNNEKQRIDYHKRRVEEKAFDLQFMS